MLKNLKEHRKVKFDIGEVLKLQETESGYDLYINGNYKEKLMIYKCEVLNDLTDKQMLFVMQNI